MLLVRMTKEAGMQRAKWVTTIVVALTLTVIAAGCNRNRASDEPPITLGPAVGEEIAYDQNDVAYDAAAGSDYNVGASSAVSTPGSAYGTTADVTPPPAPAYTAPEPSYTAPATPAGTAGRPATYTVVKGDTLFGVARKFYGDAAKWRTIHEANRDVIPDPNKLKPGQTLRLP